jgi:hypothetical protein
MFLIRKFFVLPNPALDPNPDPSINKEQNYEKPLFLQSRDFLMICYPNPDFLPIPDPESRGQKGTGSRIRICNTASYLGAGVDHELKVVVRELLDKALGQAAGVDGVGGGVKGGLVAAVQLGPEAGQLGARAVAFLQLVQQLTRCVGTLQSYPLCRALFPNQSKQKDFSLCCESLYQKYIEITGTHGHLVFSVAQGIF